MLKFSICTGVRTFTILLLIVTVTETEKYSVHSVNFPMCCHYRVYCDYQNCDPLQNAHCILSNVTQVQRDFMSVFVNGTRVHDSLSFNTRFLVSTSKTTDDLKELQKLLKNKLNCAAINSQKKLIPNFWRNTFNHLGNEFAVYDNIAKASRIEPKGTEGNYIGYRWKRRTLCAVADKEKYSSQNLERKTLMDYDESDFMTDIDDVDSLKTHVRVKRNKPELHSVSRFTYRQDYLKDLANSFPQNTYDSVDENAYDYDVSFDTKRETKTQDFLVKDEHLNESPGEPIQSETVEMESLPVPVSLKANGKSAENDFIGAPSGVIQGKPVIKNDVKFGGEAKNQRITALQLKRDVPNINQQIDNTFHEQNLPEDRMLAVELVRKKRNDATKIHDHRSLELNPISEFGVVSAPEREKRSVFESGKFEGHSNPSKIINANLQADLLRIRRKAKERLRRGKNSKVKKKKKHAGKKHTVRRNSQRPAKDIRRQNTARVRLARDRKKNEARKEGKSKVGIDRVVSKKNNGNNFRRRSEKPTKSNVRERTEKERTRKSVESARHGKVKRGTFDKVDTANTNVPFAHGTRTAGNDDFKACASQEADAPAMKGGKKFVANDIRSVNQFDEKPSRLKKTRDSNHGFTNKEDELRYYENIREPGSELDHHVGPFSLDNEMDGNRAVRSIEEVKELAKQLVTKVNELQNYLNVEQAANNDKQDKKIETRAIDDLCSNVSTACDVFKAPRIVQKCVPSTNHDSAVKIAEKKVDSVGITGNENYVKAEKMLAEKRSLGSRVVKVSPNTPKRVRKEETKSNHKWGKWTDWSSCSVTCGKGRQIRWRYCLRDCSTAETEMEEKACQLPACPPGKFLGIF